MFTLAQSRFGLARHRVPRDLRLASIACAIAIAVCTAGAFALEPPFISTVSRAQLDRLTTLYFQTQDGFWLIVVAFLCLGVAVVRLPAVASHASSVILRHPQTVIVTLAAWVLMCGMAGRYVVFHNYDLSVDEMLAEFDAIIFRSGMAIAPVEPEWQPLAAALAPRFMVPIAHGAGFASTYLPVNASIRAIVGLLADPAWTSPLLTALAVVALFGVARQLWPARLDAALVSALLLATSSQVLVTSMTSLAMTAHLTLNLIWLWFFLRDKHGAAIGVGFLACGLHQLIFHPLFAFPFIDRLWQSGRRSLTLAYIVGYAVICLFWICYWQIALAWQGLSPEASVGAGPFYFLVRVALLLVNFDWTGAGPMLKNMLRFIDWQNPILLPLLVVAYRSVRDRSGIARELTVGLALTLGAMFILMPYQGYGWGYRYLHGLIGNVSLLAGYGWIALSAGATRDEMATSSTTLVIGSAVAWLILFPAHAKQAHDFAMPYIRASGAIEHASTDLVIVDKTGLRFADDLIRNDPFLRNRPKMLDLTLLDDANLADLCARYSISIFGRRQGLAFGIPSNEVQTKVDDDARAKKRAAMTQLSCGADMAVSANTDIRF